MNKDTKYKDNTYIFVEGETDKMILSKLLPKNLKFIVGKGYSASVSRARTFMVKKDNPFLFIFDSNTVAPEEIESKKTILNDYLGQAGSKDRYKIFLFAPEIESIFTSSNKLFEKYLKKEDKPINELIYSPKYYIKTLIDKKYNTKISYINFLSEILSDNDIIEDLQKNETIKNIINTINNKNTLWA